MPDEQTLSLVDAISDTATAGGEPQDVIVTDNVSEEPQIASEEGSAPEPPKEDAWAAKEQLFKEQLAQRESEIEQYRTRMEPYEKIVQDLERQRIDQLGKDLESVILQQNTQVSPEQREQLSQVIRAGIQYAKEATVIKQERTAAAALKYASDVLGDTGTIGEWKKLAGEMYKLEAPQLMERYSDILKGQKKTTVQQERIATGADNVVALTPRAGQAMTWDALERRWANGTASPKEEELYLREYTRRRATGVIS